MKIYQEIIGNLHSPEWAARAKEARTEYLDLDQWTAQKSRFVARSDRSNEYAVALRRHTQIADGDILEYAPGEGRIVAVRIRLSDVLVADLSALAAESPERMIRTAVEFGHAVGNQHWPAVVKGTTVYVPLTVDRKVMESVMKTHHIENIEYSFRPAEGVIPYLAPHEIRRLFGGASRESHAHTHECGSHHHDSAAAV